MGWVAATQVLLALLLALATPEGFLVSAEAAEEGVIHATNDPKDAVAEGLGRAGGEEGGGDEGGDEPMTVATVQVLTEENFERITRVATGATTGDWFVGEAISPLPVVGQVNVGSVDVTSNDSLGKRFDVKGFPDLMLFSHGKVYKCYVRNLEGLLAFATGGYKDVESLPVPPPPSSIWDEVKDMFYTFF